MRRGAAIILPLDMTNHLALIKNERRHEYRQRLIAVEKSWRDALLVILLGKASWLLCYTLCARVKGVTQRPSVLAVTVMHGIP